MQSQAKGHRVEASNDGNDANVEQEEAEPADSLNGVEEDLVVGLPLDVTILVDLCWDASGNRGDANHHELNEKRPSGHVHAVLDPPLRCALVVGNLERTHT